MASNVENEERKSLIENEVRLYTGEKEPESKNVGDVDVEVAAAEGVPVGPVGEGIVMGEPVAQERQPWSTGLLSCLGNNDEFCSSDLEVCVLGLFAPCVLYGSNMERIYPGRSTFASHCMAYSSLYMMGNFLFNGNCLAPCFSFPSRTALRRSHNLEGHAESLVSSVGCCSGLIGTEEKREQLEALCDFGVHFCCHPCSLCQEGREIRRRTVHPAHGPQYYSMAVPNLQMME